MIEIHRLKKELEIPEGVEVSLDGNIIIVKSKDKEIKRKLFFPTITLAIKDKKLILEPKKFSKREKKVINTYKAHILNMFKGVQEDFEYKVEICSSHFPMSVNIENNIVMVKNFLGEKVPRKAKIRDGVVAKIEGNYVVITGADKEKVGQTAANCEQSTRITNRDRRRFQDGLWIVKKGDKDLL
ncbi:MAG: 50S ribosomal protein L6 [archaeon]